MYFDSFYTPFLGQGSQNCPASAVSAQSADIFQKQQKIFRYRRRLITSRVQVPRRKHMRHLHLRNSNFKVSFYHFSIILLALLGCAWFTGSSLAGTRNLSFQTQEVMPLSGFSFEVWGKVQGVSFRKSTKEKAKELGVCGWIRNHKVRGTVQGQIICENDEQCHKMKEWLRKVGSLKSTIDKAEFVSLDAAFLWMLREQLGSDEFEIRQTAKD